MDALREKWILELVMELHQHVESVYERLSAERQGETILKNVEIDFEKKCVRDRCHRTATATIEEVAPGEEEVVYQTVKPPKEEEEEKPPKEEEKPPKEEEPPKPKRTRKPAAGQVELPPANAIIIPEDLTDVPVQSVAEKFKMASNIIGREKTLDIFEQIAGKRSLVEIDRKFYTDIFVALKEEVKRAQELDNFNL